MKKRYTNGWFVVFIWLFWLLNAQAALADTNESVEKGYLIPYIHLYLQKEHNQPLDEVDISALDLDGQQHYALYKTSFSNTHLFVKFFQKPDREGDSTVSFESEKRLKNELEVNSITNESIIYFYHQDLVPHPRKNMVMAVYPFLVGQNLEIWLDENSARIVDPEFIREASEVFRLHGKIMGEVAKK
ncbi:hypothetical protein, partial [Sansalvadorimonas verongulae]|uniref:hypothetical protein n=1 Tax=Sansalvadorimonas verongulae TaxID=2172824 RepID=UPI0012BB55DE